jgi:hypothetical protein
MMSLEGYKKVTKSQVVAIIKKTGKFEGFMVGCKVNPFHFFEGWSLACKFVTTSTIGFDKKINYWKYYNANPETGLYPHYYVKEE